MNNFQAKVSGIINSPLKKLEITNVNNFTSDAGIKIRRTINKPVRKIFETLGTKRKIFLESYPQLEENESYIFVSSHSFDEDIIAALSQLDRHAYVLIGTTDQLEHNPLMYAAWVNGLIYVDRLDQNSRNISLPKMKRIIDSGSSVLIFAEGGWNNTEHRPSLPIFAGPVKLAHETGKKIVLISSYNQPDSNDIYMSVDGPYDVSNLNEKEARRMITKELGNMMLTHIFNHADVIERESLCGDIHLSYLEQRKKEYMRVKWTRDVWDEELTTYIDWEMAYPENVRSTFDNVEVDKNNAYVMAPVLAKRLEDNKYDFRTYMKNNWNK